MTAFLTSSPCIYGAPRAIVNPENSFADNLRRCLPDQIRYLFITSAPDDPVFTDRVAEEMGSISKIAPKRMSPAKPSTTICGALSFSRFFGISIFHTPSS
jgi:hypothetical protein